MHPAHEPGRWSITTDRTDHESAALALFDRYSAAFRALDARAVSALFHEPALFLSPRGDFALPHKADVERVYGRVMSDAKERGYKTTTFDTLRAHDIGVDQVAIEGSGRWLGANGNELMTLELSYVLRLVDTGWKIVVANVRAT